MFYSLCDMVKRPNGGVDAAGNNRVTDKLSRTSPLIPLASNDLFDALLQKLIQLAQAYLFLQPQSTIMTRFAVEGVSCVIPLDRFWFARRWKVSSCVLFCWVGISFTKLKEQC